jgi:carboxylesterase type B
LFSLSLPFSQAILQSGVAPLSVRGIKHAQSIFDKITGHLDIDALPLKEKVQALRDASAEDLVKSYIALGSPLPSWQATVDGHFLKTLPRFSTLSLQTYDPSLKRLLIGDCAAEAVIWAEKLQSMAWNYEKLQALSSNILGEERVSEVLQAYVISTDASAEQLQFSLIRLLTDAEWSQPIEAVAHSFSNRDVFYYHMAEGNPFPGPKQGKWRSKQRHSSSAVASH